MKQSIMLAKLLTALKKTEGKKVTGSRCHQQRNADPSWQLRREQAPGNLQPQQVRRETITNLARGNYDSDSEKREGSEASLQLSPDQPDQLRGEDDGKNCE